MMNDCPRDSGFRSAQKAIGYFMPDFCNTLRKVDRSDNRKNHVCACQSPASEEAVDIWSERPIQALLPRFPAAPLPRLYNCSGFLTE
jgi:hypothetical protein